MENYFLKHFKFIYVDGVRHFYGTLHTAVKKLVNVVNETLHEDRWDFLYSTFHSIIKFTITKSERY